MKLNRIYFLLQVEAEVSVVGEEAFSSPKARQLPPGTQISPMHSQQQQRLPQYREGGCKLSVTREFFLALISVSLPGFIVLQAGMKLFINIPGSDCTAQGWH